jgi:hypothetical protein
MTSGKQQVDLLDHVVRHSMHAVTDTGSQRVSAVVTYSESIPTGVSNSPS